MKLFVGVTDKRWFDFLRKIQPDEVNFWRPSGTGFKALSPGAPFLFKLHSPHNFVVGGGFFVNYSALPSSLAWETFGVKNGVGSMGALRDRVRHFRRSDRDAFDPVIGCIILSSPFFLPEEEWIPVPESFSPNIVQGKGYETSAGEGAALWTSVQRAIELSQEANALAQSEMPVVMEAGERYGSEFLARARLGQGAFRVLVTEAYTRRCAVTGERTLPALEAAHIRPYDEEGPHRTSNGLLLRADLHKLLDRGLITVTPDYRVEVSHRIKEEYENGREYYKFHGGGLAVLPRGIDRPGAEFLRWHNEERFRG